MSSRKNPFTALALSAIVPGLGQIYNQEVKKGLVIFGSCLSLGLLTYWISGLNKFSTALALLLLWISTVTDAYKVAKTSGQEPGLSRSSKCGGAITSERPSSCCAIKAAM